MAVSNESTVEVLYLYQQLYNVALKEGPITKLAVVMLLSLFLMYINGVMFYTLRSKSVFTETPRYILFAHMLLNDSIQLVFTFVLYCIGLAFLQVVTAACAFIIFVSVVTFRNAPLNLAVMSLERYVAICFPLRHSNIATKKRTFLAIAVIWCIASINLIVDLFFGIVMNPNYLTSQTFCTREKLFIKAWQVDAYNGFNVIYFLSVMLIIIFTYISIMVTARSMSSNKESATKAYRTVLLHFIQLCLCLTAFLNNIIERAVASLGNSSLFMDLRYVTFLFLLIIPRCLSPLIYGLRDEAVRPLFVYYLCYGKGKIKPTVHVH